MTTGRDISVGNTHSRLSQKVREKIEKRLLQMQSE
uniref:Uncharacterized protein n=1 Tax=Anguilla anguilla TaxID=7936 RepID=A0A0E9VTM2_ANGAN